MACYFTIFTFFSYMGVARVIISIVYLSLNVLGICLSLAVLCLSVI